MRQPEPDRADIIVDDRDLDHEERSAAWGRSSGRCIVPTSLASAAVRFHGPRDPNPVLGLRRQASWHDDAAPGTMPRAVSPTSTSGRAHRVVVVGGGFGGLDAVQALRRAPVDVTLVDRQQLPPLPAPRLSGRDRLARRRREIATPLRAVLKRQANVRVVLAEVTGFDLERREVAPRPPGGRRPLAPARPTTRWSSRAARATRTSATTSGRRYAPELKSLAGALEIRSRILRAFEAAEVEDDPERPRDWLTFVVVGGGPTGVEMAGQIAELARDTLHRDFRRSTRGPRGSCSSRPTTAC